MRRRLYLVLACGATASVVAQEHSSTFDVVSVKPNLSGDTRSGTESLPDRINATNVTLRALILRAFDKQEFQVLGGPDWVSTDRFDVVARGPANSDRGCPTPGDARRSLQAGRPH